MHKGLLFSFSFWEMTGRIEDACRGYLDRWIEKHTWPGAGLGDLHGMHSIILICRQLFPEAE
jgi:hypothetical protein